MKFVWWVCVIIGILFCIHSIQNNFPYEFSPIQSVLYDSEWEILLAKKVEWYDQYEDIPEDLVSLLVYKEDRRFWSHGGIDGKAIIRAARNWIEQWKLTQGASTIDQQIIKLDQEAYQRGWSQKVHEMWYATVIQQQLSKEEIMLRYVNSMRFMHGVVWWKASCIQYRGQSCETLHWTKVLLLFASSKRGLSLYRSEHAKRLVDEAWALWSQQYSKDELLSVLLAIPEKPLPGLLDPRVKSYIEIHQETWSYNTQLSRSIDSALRSVESQRKKYNIQDCCVAIVDKQWQLLSMNFCSQRGDSYGSMTNMCLQPRLTWSAAKPFLYSYAMHHWDYTKETIIADEYVEYELWWWWVYTPKNFDLAYHGEVSLAYALGNSLNIPAVKLAHEVGVSRYLEFIKQLINTYSMAEPDNTKTAEEVWLSIALWTYEMTPLWFTQLWRFFLEKDHELTRSNQEVISILEDPIQKVASFGQDSFLNTEWRAVKTGTSRKFVDGRVCWVHQELEVASCIWLWNSNNQPMNWSSSEVWSFVWHLVTQAVQKWYTD